MSKSNPSDIKVAVPTPGAFAGLKSLNLLASWYPARRASRIDPARVLSGQ